MKLNLKQQKYIFPAMAFIPFVFCIWMFAKVGISKEESKQEEDVVSELNTDSGTADIAKRDKLAEMERRYNRGDGYTAIGDFSGIADEDSLTASLFDSGYSEDELHEIDSINFERARQQAELEAISKRLEEAAKHENRFKDEDFDLPDASPRDRKSEEEEFAASLEEIQQRAFERRKLIESKLGIKDEAEIEAMRRRAADSINAVREAERIANLPNLVAKADGNHADKFYTVGGETEINDSPLIRAMIDQTTKASDGTRVRFKLLDDVTVKGALLRKGTYIYGTVVGFREQRVVVNITSILVGNKFIKVQLSVFDNDGMEGFYVPESTFRNLMKDAGASAMQSNININNGYGSELTGEAIAMQALQNIYSATTRAIAGNIKRNKAKIKYNTIVYLVNSEDAK